MTDAVIVLPSPPDPVVRPRPVVDVTVPVLDEERVLETSIHRLHRFLRTEMPFPWRITIVDNGSTDRTRAIAATLADRLDGVRVLHLDRRGRGLALRTAWTASDADVVAYMDVDLSTGLDALLPLVAPLVSGHSDLAIGSRLAAGASVARGPKRELISRAYNLLLRTTFATRFHDAQCGFKAVRTDVAAALLPEIADDKWFFDTELLLLAEHNGLRIHEVPVDWIDDPDSRVDIVQTATDDLRGIARMAWRFARGRGRIDAITRSRDAMRDDMGRQLVSFGIIGAASTATSTVLFLLVRDTLGAVGANLLALSATAAANTWANRRYTLARRGQIGRATDYRRGASIYVGGVALSTTALLAVGAAGAGRAVEILALAATWSATTITRFRLLRRPPAVPEPRI
jgi:putative flippase GtrA